MASIRGHRGDLLPSVTFLITNSTEACALNSTPVMHVLTSPLNWCRFLPLLGSSGDVALGWALPAHWEVEGACSETRACTQAPVG